MWNLIYWKAIVYFLAKQPSLIKLELIVLILSSGLFFLKKHFDLQKKCKKNIWLPSKN